mmetsp:Transcript_44470/g.66002  ORF Transcript_44470/g.66002 Transcript_44470/m.66002 type:complete len:92 (-) Transcript_44470:183-458(-)
MGTALKISDFRSPRNDRVNGSERLSFWVFSSPQSLRVVVVLAMMGFIPLYFRRTLCMIEVENRYQTEEPLSLQSFCRRAESAIYVGGPLQP